MTMASAPTSFTRDDFWTYIDLLDDRGGDRGTSALTARPGSDIVAFAEHLA
ncbi:hypothetical protein ABZT51_23030 [Streptomyces sp. NPDC005373]|uniref:hypothetical protein n=1 Tax=Streptomyces sp. NPDC005373 TaxID=3156879 RepID=UPI0033B1AB36